LRLSQDGSVAALVLDAATRPAEVAIIDLKQGTFRYLTDSRPKGLRAVQAVEPATVSFGSSGGRRVQALMYRPAGVGPFPVLLSIHGGPHMQERPGYGRIGLYQYLVARGVAVFAPNMAGSTGYGTSHEKLIYRDWGGVDLKDFDAAMAYLCAVEWVDAGRVAVMGGSYGGFAALSCLSRLDYPWAAGISICGPSNLVTLARECPPTWRTFVDTVLGNPDNDADLLIERSPVTYADRIAAPLFVLQGAQDPRVPQAESDQIVDKLRARGVEVRYDIYPDEGHGFTSRANEIKAYSDIVGFLIEHLRPDATAAE
jgi:dipeptidyl aminopeptidase/acylaminoacyl peptidase